MNNKTEAAPIDPDVSHAAMWHVNNFLNQEVHAYDTYTADLERQLRAQEWRANAWEERARVYQTQLDESFNAQARARAGGEAVVSAIDNMYNLFIDMCREAPQISRYHEMLQRIVLHAEAGRRMLASVDLPTDDEEEEETLHVDLHEGQRLQIIEPDGRVHQVIDLTEDTDEDM